MKAFFLIFVLSFLVCAPIIANQYDDDEKARRYFDNLDKQEQAERDAARQRADNEEAKHQDNSGGGAVILGVLAFVAMGMWAKYKG